MKPEEIIKYNREKMGLTQDKLGALLGLKLRAYQKLESGELQIIWKDIESMPHFGKPSKKAYTNHALRR